MGNASAEQARKHAHMDGQTENITPLASSIALGRGTIKQNHQRRSVYKERKCADTIGTVPVPWAGHFQ